MNNEARWRLSRVNSLDRRLKSDYCRRRLPVYVPAPVATVFVLSQMAHTPPEITTMKLKPSDTTLGHVGLQKNSCIVIDLQVSFCLYGCSMARSLSLRKSTEALIYQRCCIDSQSQSLFNFHGKLYSREGLRSRRVQKQLCQGEEMYDSCSSSPPMSCLPYSSSDSCLYCSSCEVPFGSPHPDTLSLLQKTWPKIALPMLDSINLRREISGLGYRGFSSVSDGNSYAGTESESDDEGDIGGDNIKSSADPNEVERVSKVINELFALDRNMESVLDEYEINLSHDLVLEVLERFCHARKPAFRFFCWAGEKPGFVHDSRTYNRMMNILAKSRQFETMLSMLEEMGAKELLTMETFSIAIKAFAAAKERKKAVGMFELMKKYKFQAGVETFNFLLDSLGRANLGKEAQILFEKLGDRFTPNLRTYTVLLNGWCKAKNLMEASKVWNTMIDKGFKPDIVTHNIMLEGLLRSKKRSDAIKLFTVMKSKGPSPNVRSYTIIIREFCKQMKMEEAVEYFDEMLDTGCHPDVAVYTCLITGFGNQKRLDIVYELLKEMQEKGCPPDGRTYNALIKLMTNQKMPDDAARISKRMIQSGIKPTIHTYNMIMKSYFMTRNYEMGEAVWDEMIRNGCCPDDNSYTVFIRGLISQRKSGEACKYLEEILERGMKAPQLDYNKFAVDFSKAGKSDVLDELAQKMKFSGKFEVSNIFEKWVDTMKKRVKEK